ncbi:hypothetical protein TcasGA2_TC000774 [Tribolium castaneum]|uniref:Uncharacterized protein n=1 Tax=Tribolium castaneum TaxID=7070 RepID=D6WD39_TRICA|nr:hypothetical protein TcasGA2_TC000774 [Tribolium castaneum]
MTISNNFRDRQCVILLTDINRTETTGLWHRIWHEVLSYSDHIRLNRGHYPFPCVATFSFLQFTSLD